METDYVGRIVELGGTAVKRLPDSVVVRFAPKALDIEKLLDALFTNGAGEKAERLVLTSADGRDLGGWCRGAVRDQIERYWRGANG